jgi:hypothetical protein
VTGPLAATDGGGPSRPHRALKLQEYVEELVERPPIADVHEVDRGVNHRPAPPLRVLQDDQSAHANALQRQGTDQSPDGWQT